MNRKFLTVCLMFLFVSPGFAALRKLAQSTPTTVQIHLVNASTGAGITGATVTSITGFVKKHSATSSATKTDLTFTASGGSNDVVEVGLGAYNVEFTAANTDTLQDLTFCYSYTAAVTICDTYQVTAATDPELAGDFASTGDLVAAIHEDPVPGSYAAGTAGYVLGHAHRPTIVGTADSGTTTTIVDAARTEADTDYWAGSMLVFTSGTMIGQARYITGFTPASDTITFAPAVTQDTNTETYEIWPMLDYLRATTSGRTLDVTATGAAGIDWANVEAPTSTVNLSGTTLGAISTVTTVTNLTNLPSIPAGWITAAGIASGAFTNAKFASDAQTGFANALLDLANGVETNLTLRKHFRAVMAVLVNKASGFDTNTPTFRDFNDTKNRVISTTNATGRTSSTTDLD